MNIRPSATIRQNYNEIADMCKETKELLRKTEFQEDQVVHLMSLINILMILLKRFSV